MARKKRRNKPNKGKINEGKLVAMLPGMLMAAKVLIEDSDPEWKKGDLTGLYAGKTAAAIIISAHCAELLLKYKIKQEGHIINWKEHDLYKLYKTLNADSKAAIEKEFNEQSSTKTQPNGWKSAESVFQNAHNACMDWRYAVEPGDIPLTYLQPLYIATVSVYKTIPILEFGRTPEEITDPVIKTDILTKISNMR